MSWDLDANPNQESGKVDFTKFPEGITNIRVLNEVPHQRWTHWMNQFDRSVTCPGYGCPICEISKRQRQNKEKTTYGNQKKFSMNIYNHNTGRHEIMDEGKLFMEDLRDVKDDIEKEGNKLIESVLKVRKRGEGRDATYRIDVLEQTPLDELEVEATENLVDFKEYYKPATNEQILLLLDINENDKDKRKELFAEIMYGKDTDESNEEAQEETREEIETE